MIEIYIEIFAEYGLLLILTLVVIKTLAFFLMGSKKLTYKNYLYFSENNMRNTKDPIKKRKKIFQNILSLTIFFLIILLVITFLMGALYRTPPPS